MYRIRLHGRGGQGIKTAGRILGTALFREGFEVQDAPRYGAERRGAPIFAYVRADDKAICERGVIHQPNLVLVVDESLLDLPAANVLEGLSASSVVLIRYTAATHTAIETVITAASLIFFLFCMFPNPAKIVIKIYHLTLLFYK